MSKNSFYSELSSKMKKRYFSVFVLGMLTVLSLLASCNIFAITFIQAPKYKDQFLLLRRVGKALDENWATLFNEMNTVNTKIESFLDSNDCTSELLTVESKLDYWVGPKVETIDSKVDAVNIVCNKMSSILDVVEESTPTILSKIDVASSELISIESKLDNWVGPVVHNIDSKFDLLNIELGSIESKLDQWVGPIVENIDSKVDVLQNTFTTHSTSLETFVLSPYGTILTPDTNTITTSGLYTLTANTNLCITVDADDVIINLGGFTLSCDSPNAVIEVLSGHHNIQIMNGKLQGDSNLTNSGLLVNSGCSLINVSNLKTFSCSRGFMFEGTSESNIENCRIRDCEFNTCNIGCKLNYTNNTCLQNCLAFSCYNSGFIQNWCDCNVYEKCKALETTNSDTSADVVGFSSEAGRGNLFTECFAEGTIQNVSDVVFDAYGFLFTGTERESKIINCIANSTSALSTTSGVAYGISLEGGGLGALSLIDSEDDLNVAWSTAWSPDGAYLAAVGSSGGQEIYIYSFDGESLSYVASFDHGDTVASVAWHPNPPASMTSDQYLLGIVGDMFNFQTVRLLGFDGAVLHQEGSGFYNDDAYGISFPGTNADIFAVINRGLTILLSNSDFDYLRGYSNNYDLLSVDLFPFCIDKDTNAYVAIGDEGGYVKVLKPGGANLIVADSFDHGNSAYINSVAWSSDGSYLVIGGGQGTGGYNVRVFGWSISGETLLLIDSFVHDASADIESVRWSPDDQYVLIGGAPATDGYDVRVLRFDGVRLSENTSYDFANAMVYGVDWSSNINYVAIGGAGGLVEALEFGQPVNCLVDKSTVCNTAGANSSGVGIFGYSTNNLFTKNIAYQNDTNYSSGITNVYTDGLTGSPDLLDNISLPSNENQRANSQMLRTIESKIDHLDSQVISGTIGSKVDVVNSELISIESKLDNWVGPLTETIDSKVDITNIELLSIESKLDDWIGPLTEIIDSKLDVFADNFAVSNTRLQNIILSKGGIISGDTIITTDGYYTLTANINSCVTVDANDVIIDLGGFVLTCTAATAVINILQDHNNIQIMNGKLQGGLGFENENDGLLVNEGCNLVNLSNLKTFSCNNGFNFEGVSDNNIENSKIQNCEFNTCNVGCRLNYTNNTLLQNSLAFGCHSIGFYLLGCFYNIFEKCQALEIKNVEEDPGAIGFFLLTGEGNVLKECFVEGVTKIGLGVSPIAYGIFFNNETKSKVIDCIVNSSSAIGGGDARGILLSGGQDCLVDSNKVCNTTGNGVGISGQSSINLFTRNLAYNNDTNYSANIVDVYTGGLTGSPDLLDNISLPSSENVRSNYEILVTIESKVDQFVPTVEAAGSKIDVVNIELVSIESKLDQWIGPLSETIDSTVDLLNLELVSIESKLDQWIGPIFETVESKVDILSSGVASLPDKVLSKGEIVQDCPYNITTGGMYTVTGNLNCCITINADDVILDLGGFTVYCDDGNAVVEVVSGHENIEIMNGKLKSNYPTSNTDGLLIGDGCEFVKVEDVKIFSCDLGISCTGTVSSNVKSCLFSDCSMQASKKGVAGTYMIKNVFKHCQAFNCIETGFDLTYSEFNIFDKCEALEAQGTDPDTRAIGFSSGRGRGNLFRECVAEGTSKTGSSNNFCKGAYGFLLTGTQDEMETETKIINCVANSSFVETGTGGAFGIYVEPTYIGDADLSSNLVTSFESRDNIRGNGLSWSPNGNYLAVGNSYGVEILYFDGVSLVEIDFYANAYNVNAVSWSPDGNYLAVGRDDGDEIEIYSFDGSSLTKEDGRLIGYVRSIVWSPDGNYIASSAGDYLDVWSFDRTTSSLSASPLDSYDSGSLIFRVEWSPDGKYIVLGNGSLDTSGSVIVLSFDGKNLSVIDSASHDDRVNKVDWSPGGKYIAIAGYTESVDDIAIRIFYFDGGPLSLVASKAYGSSDVVAGLSWSPDGKYIVVSFSFQSDDKDLIILRFDGASLTEVGDFDHGSALWIADWSGSGRYVAVGGDDSIGDGHIRIFEVMESPSGCLIDGNKVCNGSGSWQGSVGILGSGDNVYLRNVGYNNDANFNKALYNRAGDALQNQVNYYDNIWFPGFYPGVNR